MIKEIASKLSLGFTKNDKVWMVRITSLVLLVSLFILFYGYNTNLEDWENSYSKSIRNTIEERKVFKKLFEQGKTENELKFKDNGYATDDIENSIERSLNHPWPLDIKIINSISSGEAYEKEDIHGKNIMGNKYKARERFKSWLEQISDPEKDINSIMLVQQHKNNEIELNKPKVFLDQCMNDKGIWNDTMSESEAMKNLDRNGTLILSEKSFCYKILNITTVSGNFISGNIKGVGRITYKNQESMVANFNKGVINGISRMFRCEYGSCGVFEDPNLNQPTKLAELACYENGVRKGLVWKFLIGGGIIVGNSNSQKLLTGSRIAYVYPDTLTSIIGEFQNDKLLEGRLSELIDIDFSLVSPIPIFTQSNSVSVPDGNEIYFYEPSNQTYLGKNALQRDPYEEKYLFVANSTIPGGGRGVFLKKDVTKGEIVGFYNGVRQTGMESKIKHEDRRSPYRMDNEWAVPEQILNIPPNYRKLDQYNATFGHLINHGNQPNAWFSMIDHPRFGKIRSIEMIKNALAGEELFCDYGYIDQYIHAENTVRSIYKLGKWWTNKTDEEYHKSLKEHIKYIRSKVHSVKPYLDMLRNWVQ